jgi:hypothetical protein
MSTEDDREKSREESPEWHRPSGAARILEWCSASCRFPSVESTQEIASYDEAILPTVARFP